MSKTNLVAETGKQVIVITRVFDAPRELVFKMNTDPGSRPAVAGADKPHDHS